MFRLHRSERADALVDTLVDVVGDPLDPFETEIIAVPTRGVERWLTHRIAHTVGACAGRADGVCANVAFPFPGRLVGEILAAATGVDPETDPWRPERLVWAVLAEIAALLDDPSAADDPAFTALVHHLGGAEDDLRRGRRFNTARRVAGLFDRYGTFRPELVVGWHAAGRAAPLEPNDRWQAELWRRVRTRLDTPSPPERLRSACAAIAAGDVDLGLPERISFFGLTRLPATYLQVLQAVGTRRDVHLFALHPSLALWDRMASQPVTLPMRRADDVTRSVPLYPLLRTWAADTREMQLVLSAATDADHAHHPVATAPSDTLLTRIQADIRADREPPGPSTGDEDGVDDRFVMTAGDRSIQVHRSHGPARQVEIIRDAICHALADDPTLEPRHVIVLCPDIDAFAPLLHAAFGALNAGDVDRGVPDLPYRLADRSLRQTNPLLGALDALLDLVDSRHSAPDLVALLGREPVRRRFGFDDDDLERIHGWLKDANVRWGLDAADRERFSLGDVDGNTWRAGLDRLLLGVTMDGDGARMIDGRLPIDDVGSGDIDLVGRLAEAIDRFSSIVDRSLGQRDIARWVEVLTDATDLLFAVDRDDGWMRVQVGEVLREVLVDAGIGPASDVTTETDGHHGDAHARQPNAAPTDGDRSVSLCLSEVRALLADRLRGMPTRADFRTGAITMCTLVPMRAVPHRVVCVLGLDDESFPRTATVDGDDLLRRDPLVGDPDQRTEDRQLLLDALLSTTDRLIIATTGHDVRTNEPRPAAVPLAELLTVIDDSAIGPDGGPATAGVVTDHALQPFDPRPHLAGSAGHPWAFDRVQLAGALAAQGERVPRAPFLPGALTPPEPDATEIDLDTLIRFFAHPGREFLRQRLGVNTWDDDDRLADAIPVELDGLERWGVGTRLIDHLVAGHDVETAIAIEGARGAVPPGALGQHTLRSIADIASSLVDAARHRGVLTDPGDEPPTSHEIDVRLPSGTVVTGVVNGVIGTTVGSISYSGLKAKAKLDHWIRQLALTATRPDIPWNSVVVARRQAGAQVWTLQSVAPEDETAEVARQWAHGFLDHLVDLWRAGMCEPLPLPCETAASWSLSTRNREAEAAKSWTTAWMYPKEDQDSSWVRVLGGVLRLDQLLAIAPTAFESGVGWSDDPSRFSRLAHRVWDPIHGRSGR